MPIYEHTSGVQTFALGEIHVYTAEVTAMSSVQETAGRYNTGASKQGHLYELKGGGGTNIKQDYRCIWNKCQYAVN